MRVANPLDEESTRKFYQTSDYRTLYFGGESAEDVVRRKAPAPDTVTQLLKFVQRIVGKKGQIVEWGCGGGWNLLPFVRNGWTAIGYDFDEPYIALGSEMLGLDLRVIGETRLEVDELKRADVLLLNHVLEHSLDPLGLLTYLTSQCSSRTTFVIGIPLIETLTVWHWSNFFHIAHNHYFHQYSFEFVANKGGLEVVESDVKSGLFALRKAQNLNPRPVSNRWSRRSAWFLFIGFLEPRWRGRNGLRRLLGLVGLLEAARWLKRFRRA
ncbi:MAG: class I SAM-dependent methyltransferase [Actinomycetes bacterium]